MTISAAERGNDLFCSLIEHTETADNNAVGAGHRAGPPKVALTPIGTIVEQSIEAIEDHYSNVRVDTYAILPDHVHIILQLYPLRDGPARCPAPTEEQGNSTNNENDTRSEASLISIINALKAITAMKAGRRIWQRSFYDHIIRTDEDLYNTRRYVKYNASKHFLKQEEGHDPHA